VDFCNAGFDRFTLENEGDKHNETLMAANPFTTKGDIRDFQVHYIADFAGKGVGGCHIRFQCRGGCWFTSTSFSHLTFHLKAVSMICSAA
jgi:hypothetical protein